MVTAMRGSDMSLEQGFQGSEETVHVFLRRTVPHQPDPPNLALERAEPGAVNKGALVLRGRCRGSPARLQSTSLGALCAMRAGVRSHSTEVFS